MFDFIITNLDDILIAVSSIVTVASALAALTPTPIDDCLWAKFKKILDILALNVGKAKAASV